MLATILILLFMLSLVGGGWSYGRYGYSGFWPAGAVLLAIAVLWFTGRLQFP